MDNWEFILTGYGLTAVIVAFYVASLYRRIARLRRRRAYFRADDR